MKAIWKYALTVTDNPTVKMPLDARVLTVRANSDRPHAYYKIDLWALVDPEVQTAIRHFRIVGTGHPGPDLDMVDYIGTVFDGPFVWHVFEAQEEATP